MSIATADAPPASSRNRGLRDLAICLTLLLGVALIYAQALAFPFVNYDDQDYVYENGMVKGGLTGAGVRWALTTGHAANWHPLTWLSHMLDVTLFGLWAGGHHLTSVLLHAANVVLLFVALRRLTARVWPAAFVAAVFASHPLRAESVAWISERKDVLSTFFALLALLAYERYVHAARSRGVAYLATLACLALSLTAKQMFVTFPFVLLLLDVWPLRRIDPFAGRIAARRAGGLLLEKLPLFGVVALAAAATFYFQSDAGAVMTDAQIPLRFRLANAVVAVVRYVRMTVVPYGLAAYYPHPYALPGGFIPAWQIVGACATLLLITAIALLLAPRRPWLAVGWLWFLGTLVPVIGIVQVGNQALADRYTYWPGIGLSIAIAYGIAELATTSVRRRAIAVLAGVALVGCLAMSYRQVGFWRDSLTLTRRGAEVFPNDATAVNSLGVELEHVNDLAGAERAYRRAIAIHPDDSPANANLAGLLLRTDRADEARRWLDVANAADPANVAAVVTLADWYLAHGDDARGFASYDRAAALRPTDRRVFHKYALALAERGRIEEAKAQWRKALAIDPRYAVALDGYGRALLLSREPAEAYRALRSAIAIDPSNDETRYAMAWSLATNGDPAARNADQAMGLAYLVVRQSPNEPRYVDLLAAAIASAGRFAEAATLADAAAKLADAAGNAPLAAAIRARAALYRSGRPFVAAR